jgi:hypothetical protein
MLDSDHYRPKITPLDTWRVGASILFLAFGGYFIVNFLVHLGKPVHRTWTQLMLGCLVLLYGVYRLVSGIRNWRRMTREPPGDDIRIEANDHDQPL